MEFLSRLTIHLDKPEVGGAFEPKYKIDTTCSRPFYIIGRIVYSEHFELELPSKIDL